MVFSSASGTGTVPPYVGVMSIHFVAYRVERRKLWDLVDKVREFYFHEGPLMAIAREIKAQIDAAPEDERATKFQEALNFFSDDNKSAGELTVEMQVYEDDADHFIFRILEYDYTFMSNFESQGWEIEPIYYDNGSDVSPEEEALMPIVDRVFALTDLRRYFLTPIISLDDASMYMSEIDESPAARRELARSRYGDEVVDEITGKVATSASAEGGS